MLANSRRPSASFHSPFDRSTSTLVRTAMTLLTQARASERTCEHSAWPSPNAQPELLASDRTVEVSPPDIVQRRVFRWDGMAVELVEATARDKIAFFFRAPLHLLVVRERGTPSDGETFVEGLPRSKLRDVRRKLTFVPAGYAYHEWQEPGALTRAMYCYFEPAKMPTLAATTIAPALAPRLLFEDATVWNTALKLKRLIESDDNNGSTYISALGIVLAHELVRLNAAAAPADVPARGGLAAWQQRIVTNYIADHLAEQIPLATLAQLVRLSPYYFCRAFKQSFGAPPHRYHNSRRIDHAKAMLAKPDASVTDIGMSVGFSETSSFTAAFHKSTGLTPTAYRRSLA
jgi:AraC family transcriptional regulator